MDGIDVRLRRLESDDLADVIRLHEDVHRSLADVRFLYRHDAAFFERLIASEGVIVGAFADGRLVAYGAIILPATKMPGRNYNLTHIGMDTSQLAFGAGCGVHPNFRRTGMFKRLINERTRQAHLEGATHVTAVVSPRNDTSLRTLHELGHAAAAIHRDEDGDNFLLIRPTGAHFEAAQLSGDEVPLDDIEANLNALRSSSVIGLPKFKGGSPAFSYVDAIHWQTMVAAVPQTARY